LWLRADNLTQVASKVTVWPDLSGSGDANRTYTQANGTYQPTYVASDPTAGNRPYVSTATGFDHMLSGTWGTSYAAPVTVYTVGAIDGGQGRLTDADFNLNGGANRLIVWDSGTHFWSSNAAGATTLDTTLAFAGVRVVCTIFDGASSEQYVTDFVTPAKTGNHSAVSLGGVQYLFATVGPVGGGIGQKLFELAMCSGHHDQATRLKWRNYFAGLYRI